MSFAANSDTDGIMANALNDIFQQSFPQLRLNTMSEEEWTAGDNVDDTLGELVQSYRRPRGRGGANLGDGENMMMGLARRYSQIPS